ncbi:hypothetical protein BO70DRAFT_331650 [Aspergillus heteromorphus CBS 117.55]|uniref:Subtelomeric hrmA-associated cluster protein AFUB-079030/YDR124W-like helical bundle domain-containing protein n=1 Tax=Aspergillus heteromorphus CBS 117.55 TaxID=1448321 RepID=A0A317WPD6_9EURO|nr:uncharacterized protein BO70DRAFT_331650 [Aspergillus heteromorphus CBS 117.55]PWY88316.1 hypothetical protein BO70DRAFT_331650 [Aspergillus heteromorphus CBS 117.55]
MDAPLDGLACLHFALIYIDDSGKLRFEASPSIANNCQSILSPNVTDSFLRAVALSGKGDPSKMLGKTHEIRGRSPLSPESPSANDLSSKSIFHSTPEPPQSKRKRVSHECLVPMSITCHQKTMLPVRNTGLLRRYYEKAFDSLQQINCRILAKAYIKLVEPRKQVNYPYNGRKIISGSSQQFNPELTKPAWWPTGVTHREPDHLLKAAERIRLLVHILCELRESHSICVEKLKEADQSVRRQIAPVERIPVLDEIYHVREEEERYLDGRTDGSAIICVSRVHLPELSDSQTLGSPTQALKDGLTSSTTNPVYRKEIPDLESHTSVFPSAATNSPISSKPSTSSKASDPCKPPSQQQPGTAALPPHTRPSNVPARANTPRSTSPPDPSSTKNHPRHQQPLPPSTPPHIP